MVPTLTAPAPPAPAAPALDPVPRYCYPQQYSMLLSEVAEHELTVLHNDGLYRHLRFARPGTGMWRFDLITWPGHLTIVGDIGRGYTFARVDDMLRFFDTGQRAGHINASYWAEKLSGSTHEVRGYSEDRFVEAVHEAVEELARSLTSADDIAELRSRVDDDVFASSWNAEDAAAALESFRFRGRSLVEEVDPSSWDDYDHHFLIALHAILWGAKKYHAELAAAGS